MALTRLEWNQRQAKLPEEDRTPYEEYISYLPENASNSAADRTGIEAAASYGISEALLNDPVYGDEIKAIYAFFKANDVGAALEALYKSKYYTTMNATVRARRKEKLEQPDVYKDSLDKYSLTARRRLVQSGVKIDQAAFDSIISNAYANGLSDAQVDQAIITSGKITGFGGNILGDTTALKTYAGQFGVGTLLNDNYWQSKSQSLFSGSTTLEDIQKEIRELSASAFPAYADGIINGTSIAAQGSNVIQTVANLLERDVDTVTFDDPLVKKIMQYTDPATGKPAKMPQWMVEKTTKSTIDWGFTNNARDSVDALSLKVFKDWGLV